MFFRKLERQDLGKLLELKLESFETTHHVTIATIEDQERWFDSLDKHVHSPLNLHLIACLKDDPYDKKIGIIKISNIDWVSRTADIAWDVFKEYRGKGLGKKMIKSGTDYCFCVLNLRRLTAEVLSNNPASAKCAEHAGFTKEGTKKELTYKSDQYLDSHVYGILRQDWVYNS
jgi:RimJ/RimL family protein N-acetyltransferase